MLRGISEECPGKLQCMFLLSLCISSLPPPLRTPNCFLLFFLSASFLLMYFLFLPHFLGHAVSSSKFLSLFCYHFFFLLNIFFYFPHISFLSARLLLRLLHLSLYLRSSLSYSFLLPDFSRESSVSFRRSCSIQGLNKIGRQHNVSYELS